MKKLVTFSLLFQALSIISSQDQLSTRASQLHKQLQQEFATAHKKSPEERALARQRFNLANSESVIAQKLAESSVGKITQSKKSNDELHIEILKNSFIYAFSEGVEFFSPEDSKSNHKMIAEGILMAGSYLTNAADISKIGQSFIFSELQEMQFNSVEKKIMLRMYLRIIQRSPNYYLPARLTGFAINGIASPIITRKLENLGYSKNTAYGILGLTKILAGATLIQMKKHSDSMEIHMNTNLITSLLVFDGCYDLCSALTHNETKSHV